MKKILQYFALRLNKRVSRLVGFHFILFYTFSNNESQTYYTQKKENTTVLGLLWCPCAIFRGLCIVINHQQYTRNVRKKHMIIQYKAYKSVWVFFLSGNFYCFSYIVKFSIPSSLLYSTHTQRGESEFIETNKFGIPCLAYI